MNNLLFCEIRNFNFKKIVDLGHSCLSCNTSIIIIKKKKSSLKNNNVYVSNCVEFKLRVLLGNLVYKTYLFFSNKIR